MATLNELMELMAQLRDPKHGCPWDKQQTLKSLAQYSVEEAYEVQDAAEREDWEDLKSELGDLLFQAVFFSQIATENQQFDLSDVAQTLIDKLVSRHPHVWPDGTRKSFGQPATLSESEIQKQWEALKKQERADKGQQGVLDDVPLTLPELQRAQKLQKRAAQVGFDWPDASGVREKLTEELEEYDSAQSAHERAEELGDLFFTLVNLARKEGFDAHLLLRDANQKFTDRFKAMEVEGPLEGSSLDELEARWVRAKGLRH